MFSVLEFPFMNGKGKQTCNYSMKHFFLSSGHSKHFTVTPSQQIHTLRPEVSQSTKPEGHVDFEVIHTETLPVKANIYVIVRNVLFIHVSDINSAAHMLSVKWYWIVTGSVHTNSRFI